MKHIKLFENFVNEEFEAYNEFGLQDKENIEKAQAVLNAAEIEYDLTSGGGMTFFIFQNAEDLEKAVEEVKQAIDTSKEDEWEDAVEESSKPEAHIDSMETVLSYTDKDGKTIEVKEDEGEGMAGESMIFAYILHNGKLAKVKDVEKVMDPKDFKELSDYLKSVGDNNYASAISYVI
jgi:DNA-binding protein YbaB